MRPDPARLQPGHYPLRIELGLRFSDLDTLDHVNNVVVASYYQEVRVVLHRGFKDTDRPAGSRALVAHHAMDYLAEVNYPGQVMVGLRVALLGRSSYTLHQGLFQSGACVGLATTVMVHAEAGGARPLPPGMRAYLERFTGA